jgi:branched-chain amino acid transport system substrate-binding protein
MSDEPEILRDRYVLVAELGRGGMGVVWRAYDQILKRNVAIKQIDLGTDRALANRTVREAQITAMINHPNIVKIHDIFEDGNNFYAVMELIDGVGLDKLIDSRALNPAAIRKVLWSIASALAVAHGLGVSHRDVKPQNIIVDRGGTAHLVDFGISRTADHTRITKEGAVIGTLAYLPPEVAEGRDATFAADMWALGATMYCCCEGRPPFVSQDNRMNMRALFIGVAPTPTQAGDLTDLVRRLLHKDPAQRPTARDVVAYLDRPRRVEPPVPRPPPVPVPPVPEPQVPVPQVPADPRPPRTSRVRRVALVMAAVVTIAGVSALVLTRGTGSTEGSGNGGAAGQSVSVTPSDGSGQAADPEGPSFVPVTEVDTDGRPVAGGDSGGAADPRGNGAANCSALTAIAMSGPLTGANSAFGINSRDGAQLAVEQHNRANPECQVDLRLFDTEGDPAVATRVAPEIVADPDIIAMLGPSFSGETAATGAIFSEAGLLAMTPSATKPELATEGWSTFFRGLGNDAAQGTALANYMTGELGFGTVCVVRDDTDYGVELAQQVTTALGSAADDSCASSVTYDSRDFGAATTKVLDVQPDAVFYAGYYSDAAPFLQQLRDAGSAATFVGGDGALVDEFIELAGESAIGAYASCPCGPPSADFEVDYVGRHGARPGLYSVEGYDLATIMLRGIDSGITDRAGMVDFVRAYSGQGIARYYQWDSTGELESATVWMHQVK